MIEKEKELNKAAQRLVFLSDYIQVSAYWLNLALAPFPMIGGSQGCLGPLTYFGVHVLGSFTPFFVGA